VQRTITLRRALAALGLAGLLVAGAGGLALQQFVAWRPLPTLEPRAPRAPETALRVMLLGDSWASGQKLDAGLAAALAERALAVEVRSHGLPGARSRAVYDWLLAAPAGPLWGEWQPDVCVLLVGTNDFLVGVGADFYAHHVACLEHALAQRGIVPLVVELPPLAPHAPAALPVALRNAVVAALYQQDAPAYRAALAAPAAVPTRALQAGHFSPDGIHLNAAGRHQLAALLAAAIAATACP